MAKYDVELTYLMGKDNIITDALSHVSPLEPKVVDKDDPEAILVHCVTSEVSAMESQLERVRVAMQVDPVLSQLQHQIFHG